MEEITENLLNFVPYKFDCMIEIFKNQSSFLGHRRFFLNVLTVKLHLTSEAFGSFMRV